MLMSKNVEKYVRLRDRIEEAHLTARNSYSDRAIFEAEYFLDYAHDDLSQLEESLTDEERDELALIEYDEALSEGDRWG